MIPGGSITNRSELGVNIQKNPGLIQKNGQEIFQNEQYASCQPHFRIGLPRFRSSLPVSEWLPAASGFSGDATVYRTVLRSSHSGPVPGFGRLFGEMPPFITPPPVPHAPARLPALGRFSGRRHRLSRRLQSPHASPHPGCGEDTALRTASSSFRPDGQTRRG